MSKTERQGTGFQGERSLKQQLEKLQKPLDVTDIDFRVGRSGVKNNKAWATLLAYKDSRVDMRRLDEAFPMRWRNSYKRDSKGILQCEISIYSDELSEWVSKCSNGTASQFESEKGEYSDSFKRAGFMWGIGRELYDLPELFLWLNDSEFWVKEYNGKEKVNMNHSFKPNDWIWTIDWDHVDPHGNKGLIHAKEKGSSSYRVKPQSIFLKHKVRQ